MLRYISILIIVLLNVKSFSQNKNLIYHPFAPCSISFDSFDCHLDYEDSALLNSLTDIIVDSTNFLWNGFFVINASVSIRENDSINTLGIERVTLVYNYLSARFKEKGEEHFKIYTETYIGENIYDGSKPSYKFNLGIDLKLNWGTDIKTLYKKDTPKLKMKRPCNDG